MLQLTPPSLRCFWPVPKKQWYHPSGCKVKTKSRFETLWTSIKLTFSSMVFNNKDAQAVFCTVIKHNRHLRARRKWKLMKKTRDGRRVFSIFLDCSQMSRVFCYSVIHGLGLFIWGINWCGKKRTTIKHAFSVLYSDETWVFDQSERAQGLIYII